MKNDCTMCFKRPIDYKSAKICSRCYQWIYCHGKMTVTQNMKYLDKVDVAYNRSKKYYKHGAHLRRVK